MACTVDAPWQFRIEMNELFDNKRGMHHKHFRLCESAPAAISPLRMHGHILNRIISWIKWSAVAQRTTTTTKQNLIYLLIFTGNSEAFEDSPQFDALATQKCCICYVRHATAAAAIRSIHIGSSSTSNTGNRITPKSEIYDYYCWKYVLQCGTIVLARWTQIERLQLYLGILRTCLLWMRLQVHTVFWRRSMKCRVKFQPNTWIKNSLLVRLVRWQRSKDSMKMPEMIGILRNTTKLTAPRQ